MLKLDVSCQDDLSEAVGVDVVCACFLSRRVLLQVESLTESPWIRFRAVFDRTRNNQHNVGSLPSICIGRDEWMTIVALYLVNRCR